MGQTPKLYFGYVILNSYAPAAHLFLLSMYYPVTLIFANWNPFHGLLRWFELADVNCMKKPHECQLKITLDFQITYHGLEACTNNFLDKVSLKSGQNHRKIPLKDEGVSCFVKVADWTSANLLKMNPQKGILKDFRSSCSQVFCEIGVLKKVTKLI